MRLMHQYLMHICCDVHLTGRLQLMTQCTSLTQQLPVQDHRMPDHLESMRQEVMQTEKASFFKLHNLSGDRCCLFWTKSV